MTDRHQSPSYPLRLPEELRQRVVDAAKASGRSLNAEVISRLQASFDATPSAEVAALRQAVDELRESGRATRATLFLLADAFRAVTEVGVEGRAPDPAGLKAVRELADAVVQAQSGDDKP